MKIEKRLFNGEGGKMKPLILAIVISCVVTGSSLGQTSKRKDDLEQTIRRFELLETDAVLRSDVAALEKLWAEDFTVNNPQNQISRGRKEVLDRVRAGLVADLAALHASAGARRWAFLHSRSPPVTATVALTLSPLQRSRASRV